MDVTDCFPPFLFGCRGGRFFHLNLQPTFATIPLKPVARLVADDPIGPGPKSGRIVQPPQSAHDGQPAFLGDVPCGFGMTRQMEGMPPEALLPTRYQLFERLAASILGIHHQDLVNDLLGRLLHPSLHKSVLTGIWFTPSFDQGNATEPQEEFFLCSLCILAAIGILKLL